MSGSGGGGGCCLKFRLASVNTISVDLERLSVRLLRLDAPASVDIVAGY